MSQTYLTTEELAKRIKYDARTIRNQLKDSVLLEGVHYFRPFGGRKILYVWEKNADGGTELIWGRKLSYGYPKACDEHDCRSPKAWFTGVVDYKAGSNDGITIYES
jgi:hypothetical protein